MNKSVKTSAFTCFFAVMLLFTLSIPCWAQSMYWLGDGGRGKSLGILAPEGQGLSDEQGYLPVMIQGVLIANIAKYSAISVVDRLTLDKVTQETFAAATGVSFDVALLGEAANAGYMMIGKIIKTTAGFTLQLSIAESVSNARPVAAYSSTCTAAQINDHTVIQKAVQDLLTQMGVRLSDRARNDLGTRNVLHAIEAQTVLAQGIAAQKRGALAEALFCYFQAAALDPSLRESMTRAAALNTTISSGNIGGSASDDAQWRQIWETCLADTEKYFNNYFEELFKIDVMPYTLFYASDIKQMGATNRDDTVTLGGLETILRVSPDWTRSVELVLRSMQSSVQAVYNGLNSTRRKAAWGLDKWPQQSSMNVEPFGKQSKSFTITAELLNDHEQVIGTQTFNTSGTYDLPLPFPGRGGQTVNVSPDDKKAISFTSVKSSDITNRLIVRIATVNEEDAEAAVEENILQIMAIPSIALANIYTSIDSSNGVITNYNGRGGVLAIPSTVWDKPVTSIGDNSLVNKQLVNVTIPSGVTRIGDGAFSGNQLIRVAFPDSITSIGDNAFSRNQLTGITIPPNITFIGNGTFANNRLNSIEIPGSVMSIGDSAFFRNQLTSLTIPDSISRIGESVFAFNQLADIIIPDSIVTIGAKAFADNKLTTIDLPDSVTTIGQEAFARNQLLDIIIPHSVTEIEKDAFASNQLASVMIPTGITSIGEGVFRENKLTTVTIPHSVTEIGQDAFARNQLVNLVIPDSVTSIGDNAFFGNRLVGVTIPNSVTNIGFRAFSENRLVSVVIPDSVTRIGISVFYLNQLASVIIPDSVTSIGGWAFSGNRLTSIDLPRNITNIGENAFSWNQLTSIVIPDSVISIGGGAFSSNPITSITIGANVTMVANTFDNKFERFYTRNGKKAGVYVLEKKKWKYVPPTL